MKAISVRQPWAALIIAGIKNVENRTWIPEYRGALAIHAGKSVDTAGLTVARLHIETAGILTGGVVGVVNFAGGVIFADGEYSTDHPTAEVDNIRAWHDPAFVGWIFENARPCKFAPYSGRLGLFDIPDDLITF